MADDNETPAPSDGASSATTQQAHMRVLGQYVKDLSFENPGAPGSFAASDQAPKMNATFNVNANKRNDTEFEVELKISVTAKRGEDVVFIVELVYAGLFQFTDVPKEQLHQLVFIECPRQIFPFARRIVADATRDGGFPPLLLDPIDFVALYKQQMAAQKQAKDADTLSPPN